MVDSIGRGLNYKTIITVWSRVGFTPITKRKGLFCDRLAKKVIECKGPLDARQAAIDLIKNTNHAEEGFYYMPEYPNQNIMSCWVKL
jgi:hypothetical protein